MVALGSKPGGYELLAELGSGGMATLYLARRAGAQGFTRLAAVKVVHPHLARQERFRRMFADEAKISAEVVHPNVVRVEDFGEHEGTFFMAMEYVHGCSLGELLQALAERRNRLIPELVVYLGAEIAAGLHAAHEASDAGGRPLELVHRDVSPTNVLLAYDGHVKLIDFGVAKARFRSHQTTAASLKGKIAYMSPEQANGASNLDRRTDVYALGLVLWEALTMRRAFSEENELRLLKKVQTPDLPPPSAYASCSRELDAVIGKALAIDPAARYASALELRRALLAACPAATQVDANTISDLLTAIMAEKRDRQTALIPDSVSSNLDEVSQRYERSGERLGERMRALMAPDPTIASVWIDDPSEQEEEPPTQIRYGSDPGQDVSGEVLRGAGDGDADRPTYPHIDPFAGELDGAPTLVQPDFTPESFAPPVVRPAALDAPAPRAAAPIAFAPQPEPFLTTGRLVAMFAVAAVLGLVVGGLLLRAIAPSEAEPSPATVEAAQPAQPEPPAEPAPPPEQPVPEVAPSEPREPVALVPTVTADPQAELPPVDPVATEGAPPVEGAPPTEPGAAEGEPVAEEPTAEVEPRVRPRRRGRRTGRAGVRSGRGGSLPLATGLD